MQRIPRALAHTAGWAQATERTALAGVQPALLTLDAARLHRSVSFSEEAAPDCWSRADQVRYTLRATTPRLPTHPRPLHDPLMPRRHVRKPTFSTGLRADCWRSIIQLQPCSHATQPVSAQRPMAECRSRVRPERLCCLQRLRSEQHSPQRRREQQTRLRELVRRLGVGRGGRAGLCRCRPLRHGSPRC